MVFVVRLIKIPHSRAVDAMKSAAMGLSEWLYIAVLSVI
jgi:hypothetical protein